MFIRLYQGVFDALEEIWRQRAKWYYSSLLKIKVQYQRTKLGSLWIGVSNLISVLLLGAVYGRVLDQANSHEYFIYLAIGITTWNYLALSIGSVVRLYEQSSSRLLNTKLSPLFFSIEEWSFNTIGFLQAYGLVILVLTFLDPIIGLRSISIGLVSIVGLCLGCLGLSLITSILGVRFKDLYQIIPILLQLLFLASPILYKLEKLGDLANVLNLNVIYLLVDSLRKSLLNGDLHAALTGLSAGSLIFFLSLVLYSFTKRKLLFWL